MRLYIFTLTLLCAVCASIAQEMPPIAPPNPGEGMVPEGGDSLVRCRRPLCRMFCFYGYQKGEDGCDICKCASAQDSEESSHLIIDPVPVEPEIEPPQPPPRVPCAMPMCANRCEHGYKHDERGCMTCTCKEKSDQTEGSSSEESEGSPPCPLAACRMFCEHGLKRDSRGCHTCMCNEKPEEETPPCPLAACMMFCEHGLKKDSRGCHTCTCNEKPEEKNNCPAVMCAMFCEHGFKKDSRGCNTCVCNVEPDCSKTKCGYGLQCKVKKPQFCPEPGSCNPREVCVPASLCELQREQKKEELELMKEIFGDVLEAESPLTCEADGSFSPRQCSQTEGDEWCWCVDDMGAYIEGTKVKPEDMPADACAGGETAMVDVVFELEHDLEEGDLKAVQEDLNKLLKSLISDWMGVDKEAVLAVTIERIGSNQMIVKVMVIHDGVTDLPSAVHNMNKNIHAGNCNIDIGGGTFKPRPTTMHIKPHREIPEPYDDDTMPLTFTQRCYRRIRKPMLVLGPLAGILGIVLIVTIIAVICKKRQQSASYQFQHRRLENMENFKKNLIISSDWEKPELVAKEEVKVDLSDLEKKALA